MPRTLLPYLASALFLLACGTDESGLDELSTPSAGGSASGGSSAGTSSGGTSSGGTSSGGSSSGGTAGSPGQGGTNLGGTDAGGTDAGGTSSGGTNAGGTDAGGTSNAGGTDAGGTNAGGTEAGGTDAGGTSSGGTDAGGTDAGGTNAGGSDAGGTDAGGTNAGGTDAGGTDAGGTNAGGTSAGGTNAGGSNVGGSASGTGGTSAGGSGGSGGSTSCGTGFADACGTCLAGACCAEAEACDANCRACLAGDSTAQNCDANTKLQALLACAKQGCQGTCFQGGGAPACEIPKPAASGGSCVQLGSNGFACNPVTNEGCTNPGAACDHTDNNGGGFICYGQGNTQDLCAQCGQQTGYCKPGATCDNGTCTAYCCSDADCGTGRCDKQGYPDGKGVVGICKEPTFSGTDPCAEDLHEPNDTANSAEQLNDEDDCSFQNNIAVQGALSSSADKDWFELDFVDTNQCQLAPTFQFQGNSGIRVCAYFKCKNGSTTAGQQVQCFGGDTASSSDFGPGCCTTDGNLTPQLNCTGEDDSAAVQFRVETTNSNACLPYRVRYGF